MDISCPNQAEEILTNSNRTQSQKELDGYCLHRQDFQPFAITWIDLEDSTLSEINQTEIDKYR